MRIEWARACVAVLTLGAATLGMNVPSASAQVFVLDRGVVRKAPECAPLFQGSPAESSSISNLWQSAKTPALKQHCEEIGRAVEDVRADNYASALARAKNAEVVSPHRAGPWVIRGMAYARCLAVGSACGMSGSSTCTSRGDGGTFCDFATMARQAFDQAKAADQRALDDAEVLDDLGTVLVRTGALADARRVYRTLLPRIGGPEGLCAPAEGCERATLAYLTAGLLALEGGPSAIDEAIAILREARTRSEQSRTELRRLVPLLLALALDRRGDVEQARQLASETIRTRGMLGEPASEIAVRFFSREERLAVFGFALETLPDPAGAASAYRAYLETGASKPWAAHVREHLARLERATPKPTPSIH